MEWLRWYHGAVSDDKWPLIARKSGQSVAVVIAVWAALLECASSSEVRGDVHDFDPESMDALMQLPDGATQAVVTALSEGKRPRIIDGMIANWSKRQPVREREDGNTSAERVRAHRERQKALQNKETSDGNASVTPCNADETPVQHHETPRTEKRREEKNINTPPTPKGGNCGESSSVSPTPKNKAREPTGNSLPELRQAIAEYTAWEPLRKALEDYRLMRERIRKPMTGEALRLALRELNKLSGNDDGLKIAILEQSILNSWQGLFALKGPVRAGQLSQNVLEKNMETGARVLAMREQRRQNSEQPTV